MKDLVKSDNTGKEYDATKVVRIVNYKQAAMYMKHGAELLDIYVSHTYKTNEPLLVFIFDRAKTTKLYDSWCKYELK